MKGRKTEKACLGDASMRVRVSERPKQVYKRRLPPSFPASFVYCLPVTIGVLALKTKKKHKRKGGDGKELKKKGEIKGSPCENPDSLM